MNSTFEKGLSMFPRAFALAGAIVAAVLVSGAGCVFDNTSEGDRCNPLDSHNECASGLVCTGQGSSPAIPFCPENYCCPVDSSGNLTGSNPNCQPGCNGGAQAICNATKDPGACAFAAGGTPLAVAEALDDAGSAATPAADAATSEAGEQ